MHAARAGKRDLLGQDDVIEQVGGRAAVFLGKAEAEKPRRRGLAVELARKLSASSQAAACGTISRCDESPHRFAERLVLVR